MAEKQETPKILEEISKGTNPKSGGISSRSQKNARRRFLIILFLFLPLLASTAYLGFMQYKLQIALADLEEQNNALSSNTSRYESEIAALSSQLAAIPDQVSEDTTATDALATRLNNEVAAITEQLSALAASQAESNSPQNMQWKIMEANYLVQLANRKLQLEEDVPSALMLLDAADSALVESGSSVVLRARQALANDISLLRDLNVFDREGAFIRLDNVSDQFSAIDLVTSMRENLQNRTSSEASSSLESTGFIDSSFAFLSSVFVWRRWEDSPEAMLAPGQETMILQRMQLLVEQAKLALLNRDALLYQRSLEDVASLVRQYAMADSESGQAVSDELSALLAVDVAPVLPALNQSVSALQQIAATVQ